MTDKLIWIDCGYACGGIIIDKYSTVIETCPIYKWMLNKKLEEILKWDKIKKHIVIEKLNIL